MHDTSLLNPSVRTNFRSIGYMWYRSHVQQLKVHRNKHFKSLMYENVNAEANRRVSHSMNIKLILKYKKEEIKTGGVMLQM